MFQGHGGPMWAQRSSQIFTEGYFGTDQFFTLGLIFAVILVVVFQYSRKYHHLSPYPETALEVITISLAEGEITREEYDRIRDVLMAQSEKPDQI